jgi:hypothetical protein
MSVASLTRALVKSADACRAAALGVSVAAVKKSRRDIYDRVYDRIPELFPAEKSQEEPSSERGKAKKHRLLSYIREHPEELRPIARKKYLSYSQRPGKDLGKNSKSQNTT